MWAAMGTERSRSIGVGVSRWKGEGLYKKCAAAKREFGVSLRKMLSCAFIEDGRDVR